MLMLIKSVPIQIFFIENYKIENLVRFSARTENNYLYIENNAGSPRLIIAVTYFIFLFLILYILNIGILYGKETAK